MRIKSNLNYDLTIEFYRLSEDGISPKLTHTFSLLPKEEIDISPESLENSNFIVLFHSWKGISVRLLEKGAAVFKPESKSSGETLSIFLPGSAYEPITNDLKTDLNLWVNPPICVISEKAR